jgi:hypothetical protein
MKVTQKNIILPKVAKFPPPIACEKCKNTLKAKMFFVRHAYFPLTLIHRKIEQKQEN